MADKLRFFSTALFIFLLCSAGQGGSAKSSSPITDTEIWERKCECYADIDSGLWGWQCKSSKIAREDCALRCLSPTCYKLVYEGDPLEEGEIDYIRGQEYKYCMHLASIGESLDGVKGSFNY